MKKKKYEVHGMSEFTNPINKPSMGGTSSPNKQYPSKGKIQAAGHEMKMNPPKQLAKTEKKFGKAKAKKQKIAILLSKARRSK